MAAAAATLVATEEDKTLVLKAEGEWLLATAAELDRRARVVQAVEAAGAPA